MFSSTVYRSLSTPLVNLQEAEVLPGPRAKDPAAGPGQRREDYHSQDTCQVDLSDIEGTVAPDFFLGLFLTLLIGRNICCF